LIQCAFARKKQGHHRQFAAIQRVRFLLGELCGVALKAGYFSIKYESVMSTPLARSFLPSEVILTNARFSEMSFFCCCVFSFHVTIAVPARDLPRSRSLMSRS
jgi:hypothetical protein